MEARSRFEDLPARPPTPPKENGLSSDGLEAELPFLAAKLPKPALDTPNESPCSNGEAPAKLSDRPSKRVDFQIGSSKLVTVMTSSPYDVGSARSHPSSRDSRPVKSILKQSAVLVEGVETTPEMRDFPRMLDDFARQLAAASAGSRLDAYVQLNNCLKTYKNMPEQQALREKMPLLTNFIERDLQETVLGEGARSTQLATEVVRLVTTLLWSPTMGDVLPESFQCFIVDKSIAVAGSDNVSKALVNQYLHLLGVQSFRSKIMNTDRGNRLITNLNKIAEHVKGKGVVAHKLDIYKKLLSQAPNIMHGRFRDWYECLFHSLIANQQEIRVRALSLAYEAGIAFGTSDHVTKAVMNLFNHKVDSKESNQRFGDLYIARLQERLASKEERTHVPQLWAAVLLFLRHQSQPLERWAFTGQWLRVLQHCFNSGDIELKMQANRAWIRLIYVVGPDISTKDSMVALLRTPLEKQFDRLGVTDKETKKLRSSIVATYTTLLYYAFNPQTSFDAIDRFWSQYVAHFFTHGAVGTTPLDVTTGAAVLCSLLGGARQQVWNAARATESAPIKADELPRVDPKWTRTRTSTVLATLENALLSEEWWSDDLEQSPALRVWRAYTDAIREASRKEVKASSETMHAVAGMLSTLVRFFNQTKFRAVQSDKVYQRLAKLLQSAVSAITYLPFVEQRLEKTGPEKYSVTAAPAGRAYKASSPQTSAFSELLDVVVSSVDAADPLAEDCFFIEADALLDTLIQSSLKAGSSLGSRLDILRGLCSRVFASSEKHGATLAMGYVWAAGSRLLVEDLGATTSEDVSLGNSDGQVQDLRNLAKILELGTEMDKECNKEWLDLWHAIQSFVCHGSGSLVWTAFVVKPVIKSVAARQKPGMEEQFHGYVKCIIQTTPWLRQPEAVEKNRKDLWRALGITMKQAFDIHSLLSCLIGQTLSSLYYVPLPSRDEPDLGFLATIPEFMSINSSNYLDASLKGIAQGLATWAKDECGVLGVDSVGAVKLFRSAVSASNSAMEAVLLLGSEDGHNQQLLNEFDSLVNACLASHHRAIANFAIEIWNKGFGLQKDLEYSETLHRTLLRLDAIAEISAAGLQNQADPIKVGSTCWVIDVADRKQDPHERFVYLPTPAQLADLEANTQEDAAPEYGLLSKQHRKPLAVIAANDSPMTTPNRSMKDHKPSSTPRLRHNDSQIEFAAITSSPPNLEALESQLMTEHQREVRDRQHAEAKAMFPDLRSSPRPKTSERDLPRLKLRTNSELPITDVDDPHSPTLPPPSETPFLGSSPTPSQRMSRDRTTTSSRGSIDSQLATRGESTTLERSSRPVPQSATSDFSSELQTFGEELLALYEEPVEEIVTFPPSSEALISSDGDDCYAEAPCYPDPANDEETQEIEDQSQEPAGIDIIPVQEPVPEEHEKRPSSWIAVEKEQFEDYDGPIAAQILNDIDRATSMSQDVSSMFDAPTSSTSQNFQSATEEPPSSERSMRSKRKREDPSFPVEKRSRAHTKAETLPSSQSHAAANSDDDMEDCIVVACSRPRREERSRRSTMGGAKAEGIRVETFKVDKPKIQRPKVDIPRVDGPADHPQRRPIKSSPTEESSCPSSEAVFDVPPTPEVRRARSTRKRPSTDALAEAEPAMKRMRSSSRHADMHASQLESQGSIGATLVEQSKVAESTSTGASDQAATESPPAAAVSISLTSELKSESSSGPITTSEVPAPEMSHDAIVSPPIPKATASAASHIPDASTPTVSRESGVPSPAPSTPRRLAVTGAEFLTRVRQLLADARHVVLGGQSNTGDEIMAGLMDVGKEVMDAKRRV